MFQKAVYQQYIAAYGKKCKALTNQEELFNLVQSLFNYWHGYFRMHLTDFFSIPGIFCYFFPTRLIALLISPALNVQKLVFCSISILRESD